MTTQAPEQEADSAAAKVLAILAMYEAATITQDTAAQAIATATFAGKAVASRWPMLHLHVGQRQADSSSPTAKNSTDWPTQHRQCSLKTQRRHRSA